ncbi:DNA-binding transcriptional regulator, CsgD family [Roseivivax lentus]|uniref:DNA-binding transcriptional regulator, CsgD family n=1 Tax=Roseivivax lentus TaxID=633194 RepID=A0A1N7PLI8_9RHOB|nr:LuxR C-terminal-related transcriptional regulator [Roseivivax lentus]SIT11451.1 DNA-binding transcriptional regulator, CsgD family [Roseivivax lentus]
MRLRTRIGLALLLGFQLVTALFFQWELLSSVFGFSRQPISWALYELIEVAAALGLLAGVCVTALLLYRSQKAQAQAEANLRLASGAFHKVLEERFEQWRLTPAERDVALFSIKGLSTAEMAAIRGASEGTIKAQTNAIYRKAEVSGRGQLMSLFIDELMGDGLPGIAALQKSPELIEKENQML